MPTILTHTIVAAAGASAWAGREAGERLMKWSIVLSILPDADVLGLRFGIHYGDLLGHRGLSHSLPFAMAAGAVAATFFGELPAGRSRRGLAIFFAAIMASHGVLDALTDGGLGIAFLSPFSNHRCFLPWQPIRVSPLGPDIFSRYGMEVLASEFLWVCLPAAVVWLAAIAAHRFYRKSA